ncbi:MAG: hypothetical protein ACSHYB_16350 [Roseibacillus sp.]
MLSWILIPAYLFKNSIHRWFENIASPATKLLIPFLLALFGLIVFGFLRGLEGQLKEQLEQADLRTILTAESIRGADAPRRIQELESEERLWSEFCERFESFDQVPLSGATRNLDRLPVLAYSGPLSFIDMPAMVPGEPEEVFLLATGTRWSERVDVLIKGYEISAKVLPLPEMFDEYYQKQAVVLVPRSLVEPVMLEGFTHIQILVPEKTVTTARLEGLVRAQARLEDRQLRVDSSVEVLNRLEKLLSGQRLVRLALAGALALILSLILGALALLEFRHEAYILALLRSFGVRAWVLAVHFFIENLFLTVGGLALGWLVFVRMGAKLLPGLSEGLAPGMGAPELAVVPVQEDVKILLLASVLGVVLAVIPVLWGLRKRPGLILS